MKKTPIAYQLYCVRNQMEQDLEGTLRRVKELGFDGVEFAGFFGRSAAQMKALLAQNGLTALSSHVPIQQILADPKEVIRYHKELAAPTSPSLTWARKTAPARPALPGCCP